MGGERGGAGRKIKMGWKWNGGILSSRQERGKEEDRVADGILDLARFLGEKIPVAPSHFGTLT